MSRSDADRRAAAKYKAKQDSVQAFYPAGTKDRWKAAAAAAGLSLAAFIAEAVEAKIQEQGGVDGPGSDML